MQKFLTALVIQLAVAGSVHSQQTALADYVNTLQGTNSKHELTRGNTYPTTALPFGMHTWTPQTGNNGDGWKYQYHKKSIRGFQQAHQCSSWSNDYAVFSLFPVIDKLIVNQDERASDFEHENEVAKPYYYSVTFNNKIKTEISPTERGAHLRFSFPKGHTGNIILDGYTRLSGVKIYPEEKMVTGFVNNGRGFQKGWKSFFVIVFDTPFTGYGTWDNTTGAIQASNLQAEGKGTGLYLQFKEGATVQVRTASSYISEEQAKLNLSRESGNHKTLEQTKAAAKKIWNDHLSRILVEGGTEADKATFYSCFFRASLFSRKFYELNKYGKPYYFSPYDGKVHDGYMYTDTGFWDTFRAQFPLNALLHPEMHGRYMQALLAANEQCGWLPSWSFPNEQGSMIGNHAISLLADAWAKGIRTFDPAAALEAYHHEANNKGPWGPANGRDGYKEYNQIGYVPYPKYREATAKTLEYAYDDFCAYALATDTKQEKYRQGFEKKMFNYRHVFDSTTGFMRGRDENGNWLKDFDPIEWGGPYTEGNAWHWLWSVFHDINGLIIMLGGDEAFCAKLDAVFTQPSDVKVGTYGGMIHEMTEMVMAKMGQYAHGNQPIQHMVYLYNYGRQPWKTQFHVREVMSKLYNASEDGYPGDEDQGQTSSWYVLSALGFYSVCPGTNEYVLGSPVFRKTTIRLENGKKFIIEANGNSAENVYTHRAMLNGKPWSKTFITYQDITAGGTLSFDMKNSADKQKKLQPEDLPYSVSRR